MRRGLLLLPLLMFGCVAAQTAQITTYDDICLPDDKIQLKAQLEDTSIFHGDIQNETILFYQNGRLLGTSRTNRHGIATLSYTAPQEGFVPIEVRLESQKYRAPNAPLLLRVAKPDAPFLVVDIDNTISDISPILMLFTENAKIPPMRGAPEALTELSRRHTIVYLTGRDETLAPKTKAWLSEYRFPLGPVFFWDFLHTPFSKRKYKSSVIHTLGRKFQLIQIGVGNSMGDALAYVANGLRTFIFLNAGESEKRKEKQLPRGACVVKSWGEIQKILSGEKASPLNSNAAGGQPNKDRPAPEASPTGPRK